MSEPIYYVDRSEIVEGKLEELRAAIKELVEFVYANEPQLISYGFFFNDESTRMTVVGVHPDSASLEFHLDVAGPAFRRMTGFIQLQSIEIYGRVSDKALNQLRHKAQMLGTTASVSAHEPHSGFARFPS
jgi:hypothetical protein